MLLIKREKVVRGEPGERRRGRIDDTAGGPV
jgi:hypothetical protein